MSKFIERLLRKLGIDRAIFFVLAGRALSFISQPITIYLIARYFTPSEQGYYYTFANILSLSILVELSLGVVLTQFASHEFAYLSWGPDGSLTGDPASLSRMLSLARNAIRWYGVITIFFLAMLIPVGLYFFGSDPGSAHIDFSLPWICLVLFGALNLIVYPVLSIIEGCGKVADIQQMRLYQTLFGAVLVWAVILANGGLLAAAVLAASNFTVSVAWLYCNFKGLFRQVQHGEDIHPSAHVSWRGEVMPMQWRIAVSSISGFLVSQLFNPLLFRFQSPAVAGQMGMSMSIANVALVVSIAWVTTKFPTYGSLIQKKKFRDLDTIALRSTAQALFFSMALSVLILMCVHLLKLYFPQYGNRLLSIRAVGALLLSNMLILVVTSMAGYLRAHKVEPLLTMSVLSGVTTAVGAWVCARYFTAEIMTYAVVAINLMIALPLTTYIFLTKRREWHATA